MDILDKVIVNIDRGTVNIAQIVANETSVSHRAKSLVTQRDLDVT